MEMFTNPTTPKKRVVSQQTWPILWFSWIPSGSDPYPRGSHFVFTSKQLLLTQMYPPHPPHIEFFSFDKSPISLWWLGPNSLFHKPLTPMFFSWNPQSIPQHSARRRAVRDLPVPGGPKKTALGRAMPRRLAISGLSFTVKSTEKQG